MSGNLNGRPCDKGANGEGRGRIAKAPPPEAFQLMLMYLFCCNVRGREIALISDCNTYSRGSDKVCVPCAVSDFQILVSIFLLASLTVNVSTGSSEPVCTAPTLSDLLTGTLRAVRNETWTRFSIRRVK